VTPGGDPEAAPLIPDRLDATLVLVRHGESEYIVEGRFQGQADTPLSRRGIHQATLVAGRLATPHQAPPLPVPSGLPLELVHSPLARTRQTAEAIQTAMADASGRVGSGRLADARPDAAFKEIGQGAWEGLHRDEIVERYGAELAAWRRRPTEVWAPGGESLALVAQRVRTGLEQLLATLAAAGVPGSRDRDPVSGYGEAPATHPWSILVGHDGVFKVSLLTLFGLPLERFWMWTMDLCAITIIEFRAGQPVVRAHNLTGHLASLLDERTVEEQEARSRSGAL